MKPTVGRIVHVINRRASDGQDESPRAAIVTDVSPVGIFLTIFNMGGVQTAAYIGDHVMPTDPGLRWEWPPR